MISEIGKTIQRGFVLARLGRFRITIHVESSTLANEVEPGWCRPQRSLRIVPHPTDVPGSPRKGYRLQQIPPMSRPSVIVSNFEGTWLVTQFLPIAPQLVSRTPLDAESRMA